MNTTIQISKETKELISTFGAKNETYDIIVRRLYDFATKEQLRQFLLESQQAVPVKEALERAEKRWQ